MLLSVFLGCNDLNVPPINIVKDSDIFQGKAGMDAYMSLLYKGLPWEDFTRYQKEGCDFWSGEALTCTGDFKNDYAGTNFRWWGYKEVRDVNYLIQELPNYKGNFSLNDYSAYLGEAYLIRAYYYFGLVRRYGGVPIIKEPQDPMKMRPEELNVPRAKEQEVYDFIADDIDESLKYLSWDSPMKGRMNKGVAYALKTRAMLFAGSIAKYGTSDPSMNGILGIPESEANRYFNLVVEAARELEKSGKYELYKQKYPDKFANYYAIFYDESNANKEVIFAEYYHYPEKTHRYDRFFIPWQMRSPANSSSRMNPTLDLIEMYDDVDGNPFILETGPADNPVRYEDRMDLFAKAEPRLRATVIFPGDVFKNEVIDVRNGIYPTFSAAEKPLISSDFNATYKDMSIIGKSGPGTAETTTSGFYFRKYCDDALPSVNCDKMEAHPWIDLRYAEVLLNRAEALVELGGSANREEARRLINEIRDRAGTKPVSADKFDLSKVRKERRCELAFERQTFWDLIRWRVADKEIANRQWMTLQVFYVYDEGKYIFLKKPRTERTYTFHSHTYYTALEPNDIKSNKSLIQNPGY